MKAKDCARVFACGTCASMTEGATVRSEVEAHARLFLPPGHLRPLHLTNTSARCTSSSCCKLVNSNAQMRQQRPLYVINIYLAAFADVWRLCVTFQQTWISLRRENRRLCIEELLDIIAQGDAIHPQDSLVHVPCSTRTIHHLPDGALQLNETLLILRPPSSPLTNTTSTAAYAAVAAKTSALLAFVHSATLVAKSIVYIATSPSLAFGFGTRYRLTIAPMSRTAARTSRGRRQCE